MPCYDFSCSCGKYVEDIFHHMNDEKKAICECGASMKRVYSPAYVLPDFFAYTDHTLGYVDSRQDKKRKMKEKGLHIFEPGQLKGQKRSDYNEAISGAKEKIERAGKKHKYHYEGTN